MPIRVLIADDSAIIRKAVRRLLETEPDIQILAEAVDLRQMLELRNKLHPDIVVMDLRTCSMLWYHRSRARHPFRIRYATLSNFGKQPHGWRAQSNGALGASGYIDKMELFDKLIPTLRNIADSQA